MWRNKDGDEYSILVCPNGENYIQHSLQISKDNWNFIIFKYDKGACTWKNLTTGENITDAYSSGGFVQHQHIYLGNSTYNGTPSSETDECCMSDFRIYATPLSDEDINKIYN
jgi:hypothetical protein